MKLSVYFVINKIENTSILAKLFIDNLEALACSIRVRHSDTLRALLTYLLKKEVLFTSLGFHL